MVSRNKLGRFLAGAVTPIADRFWPKVAKTDKCWLWTGGHTGHGYGVIGLGTAEKGTELAHRVSWEMANGKPVPDSLEVLHSCDNPPCVRPDHLFLGTQQDNIRDRDAKGRGRHPNPARGEHNGNSKLTAERVSEIRTKLKDGRSSLSIGREYGVHHSTILGIRNGVSWAVV
jgi:hypothetical protein